MSQFEEVLDRVRLALTWSSPAEMQALLDNLVKEQIISESYSKSLSLHGFTDGITPETTHSKSACEVGSDQLHSRESTTHQSHCSQVRNCGSLELKESEISDHNHVRFESISMSSLIQELRGWTEMNEHYLDHKIRSTPTTCNNQQSLRHVAQLLQKPISDSERTTEGNSDDGREWLEKLEEAARRIAVPLWQHWDRGQKILLSLVPCISSGAIDKNKASDSEKQLLDFNMELESELAVACTTLDPYHDRFKCMDTSFTLDLEGATVSPKDLLFSEFDGVEMTGLTVFDSYGAAGSTSPAQAYTATDTNNNKITDTCLESQQGVCWADDKTTYTTVDLACLREDTQCSTDSGFTDVADLLSPFTPNDTDADAQENLFSSNTDHSITSGVVDNFEDVFRTTYVTSKCSVDHIADFYDMNKKDEERVDSFWGAKMKEVDHDPFIPPDLGDLPDDLSEYMRDDYFPDTEVLLSDDMLHYDDFSNLGISGDATVLTELPCPGSNQQGQSDKLTDTTNSRRKRQRASRSQRRTAETTPSRPKRRRTAGKSQTKEVQDEPAVTQSKSQIKEVQDEPAVLQSTDRIPELSPVETTITTPNTRILRLHPSIQFVIPDTPGYQVVQTVRLSPPLIRFPLPNTGGGPAYILVPATSPPSKCQVQPCSPTDGAVAPVQMSSSPPGSLSDTASKAMSPPCSSPLSPRTEMSPCKESPPPQSPTVPDIPQVVKDYIQKGKVHISHTCQDMEEGLGLTSHYVDMKVHQHDILRSGKNTMKCLDKELIMMGHTDHQNSLLGQSQIFEDSNGEKAKRYILLVGNAGMGKTTMIRKLCLDWSRDCIPQFDFIFLLDGKALTLTNPAYSLQTLLLNLSSFAPSCEDLEAVYAQILAAPKRVLIIFDGFDELRDYETLLQTQEKDLAASLQKDSKAQTYTVKQLYSSILQRVLLPECTLLLSTRPRGTASQLLRRADRFLKVCGFSPTDVETYLSQYFTDPTLRASALDCLKNCSYLHFLCWNPGLCRLVCLVLEQFKGQEDLPRTLTGLCHQVIRLKLEKDSKDRYSQAEVQTQTPLQTEDDAETHISGNNQSKRCQRNSQAKSRGQVRTRTRARSRRARGTKEQEEEENEVDGEIVGGGVDRTEERELLSQLSSLAWEGVKANSSIVPTGRTLSAKLKDFCFRTKLFLLHSVRTGLVVSSVERQDGGRESKVEIKPKGKGDSKDDIENFNANDDHIILWANPFLQSYLAAVHLSLSRSVSDRTFLQTLPFQVGPKGRRRPQREELELTQRFAVGLLFHNRSELQRLHSCTETSFRDMIVNKQALVTKHLEGLTLSDLTPTQILELCQYVYEASFTQGSGSTGSGLVAHLAANLPEVLTFHGVPLNPPDVFAVQNVLEKGGTEGRSYCLDLEDSGIQVSGLRTLVGLNNINTYRACIADVITLWEQLEQSAEEGLLHGAVSKFKIHPLKATQLCHVDYLARLVNIHIHKRLSDSCSQSDSILAEGVPAIKELHKLEFELGPEKGPLGLPKLWELLPGLTNLQHLDLENSKLGDDGAEKLANALTSLNLLEILNLSQNCIGDQGVKHLATTLKNLPKLHCLSLYGNVISDEGAESLAAVLPHMSSLTDLDVKYNKMTDVGAQSLGASLRNCQKIKTLRMWNQCIPYGVFERLQQQDNRIL